MKSLNFWKLLYILVLTLAGVFLLLQKSIDIYWDQTYHQKSPIHLEKTSSNWAHTVSIAASEKLTEFKARMQQLNQTLEEESNQKLAFFYPVPTSDDKIIDHLNIESVVQVQNTEKEVVNTTKELDVEFGIESTSAQLAALSDLVAQTYWALPQKQRDYLQDEILIAPNETVFFAGDSLMQGIVPHALRTLSKTHNVNGLDLSKQSTGLSYPNAFNWPKTIEEALSKAPSIKVLVLVLGANDPWDFSMEDHKAYLKFQSPEWEAEYRKRIRSILESAQAHFVKVVWLEVPCMKKVKLDHDVHYLNQLYHSEVELAGQRYVETANLLGCENGYSDYAKVEGKNRKVRTRDGIHFEISGQKMLANQIIQQFTFKEK